MTCTRHSVDILGMLRCVVLLLLWAGPAQACLTAGTGAKCQRAADSVFGIGAADQPTDRIAAGGAKFQKAPEPVYPVDIGQELPANYYMLANSASYGLPRPSDGWTYFRVEREVYRVNLVSREVLERVTDQLTRPLY